MAGKKIDVEANAGLSFDVEKKVEKKNWEKPNMEDVSGKVMAQPYIRFT